MIKRWFGFVLVLTLVLSIAGIAPAFAAGNPYYGSWTVSKMLLKTKDATLSAKAQKALIGKAIALSATSAASGTKKLATPNYQISEMTASDFEGSWGIAAKKLGLPGNITMVEVYSGKGMTAEMWSAVGTIFVASNSVLVMHVDGVFFQLKKK